MPLLPVYLLLVVAFLIGFGVFFLRNRKNSAPSFTTAEKPVCEKIYVTSSRVMTLAFAFFILGTIFISLGLSGIPYRDRGPNISEIILIIIGGTIAYQGARFFYKRNNLVQLKMTIAGIYYKPVKWYSHGRGGLNALSVYFAEEWCFTAYQDLSHVALYESGWLGNSIYIFPKKGKRVKLFFFIDDGAQVVELYRKIKNNIPDDGFSQTV